MIKIDKYYIDSYSTIWRYFQWKLKYRLHTYSSILSRLTVLGWADSFLFNGYNIFLFFFFRILRKFENRIWRRGIYPSRFSSNITQESQNSHHQYVFISPTDPCCVESSGRLRNECESTARGHYNHYTYTKVSYKGAWSMESKKWVNWFFLL